MATRRKEIADNGGQTAAREQHGKLSVEPEQIAAPRSGAGGELKPAGQRDIAADQCRRDQTGSIGATARERPGQVIVEAQGGQRRGFAVALGRAGEIDQIVAIALAQKLDIEPLVDRIEGPFAEFDRVQRYHATARVGYRQSRSARRIGIDRQHAVLPGQLDQPRADIAVDGNFG